MEKFEFKGRTFKLWFYHVSHCEAVIRSPKNMEFQNNIDIYFGDIQYIEIPTTLTDVKLANANEDDIMYLKKKIGKSIQPDNVMVLLANERRFYIVSSTYKIMMNSLALDELPIATFMKGK